MLTRLLAVLGFVIGIVAAVWSLASAITTGEHLATLSVAGFAMAAAVGIWELADKE